MSRVDWSTAETVVVVTLRCGACRGAPVADLRLLVTRIEGDAVADAMLSTEASGWQHSAKGRCTCDRPEGLPSPPSLAPQVRRRWRSGSTALTIRL